MYINKTGQANNNYDIQVGPNANVNIQVDNGNLNVVTKTGQFNFDVGSDFNVQVGGDYNLTVLGNKVERIEGTHVQDTTGQVHEVDVDYFQQLPTFDTLGLKKFTNYNYLRILMDLGRHIRFFAIL